MLGFGAQRRSGQQTKIWGLLVIWLRHVARYITSCESLSSYGLLWKLQPGRAFTYTGLVHRTQPLSPRDLGRSSPGDSDAPKAPITPAGQAELTISGAVQRRESQCHVRSAEFRVMTPASRSTSTPPAPLCTASPRLALRTPVTAKRCRQRPRFCLPVLNNQTPAEETNKNEATG